MKKLFAMLLSVAIILSTITIPAYAETGSPTDNAVVFSVENVTAAPGTDVSVAFNIEGEYESHALTAFVICFPSSVTVLLRETSGKT